MCGIAGIYGPHKFQEAHLMGNAIRHRGPDQQTQRDYTNLSVNFNRLAILDTSSAASHPQTQGNWSVWLNGCIYNYRALKHELKGYAFASDGDTEVVAALIDTVGIYKAIPQLNGMFALLVRNNATGEAYLIRDRYGVKPIYYAEVGECVVFASEIKAILQYPRVNPRVNWQALGQWMTFQNVHTDETLFAGIKKLPKGTIMNLGTKGQIKYWGWNFEQDGMKYEEAVNQISSLFEKAVTRQMVSDVPVATWCSGGVDSSAIAAVSRTMLLTCGYTEPEYDERKYAEAMAIAYQRPAYSTLVGPEGIRMGLEKTIWHLEDLRSGPCYSNLILYHLTGKFAKVCLHGTGGDELFGGYSWRYNAPDYWNVVDRTKLNMLSFQFDPREYYCAPKTSMDRYHHDAEHFMEGVLICGDKLSSAYGLEARVPFLDNDLVDFAQRLPMGFKNSKRVFKDAMKGMVPNEILYRQKKGFTSPEAVWLFGQNKQWAENFIQTTPGLFEYLDGEKISLAFQQKNAPAIWCVLAFAQWMRIFLK